MTSFALGLSDAQFAERVVIALAFGTIIGLERQWRQRMAGLRTNALVATGTALFILVTPLLGPAGTNTTQIAAYVVSGIGFLAGGVIFKERLSITGLNTAATLWCTAAIGELVGFGFVVEAAIGVAAILFANVVLRPIVQSINRRPLTTSDVDSFEIRAICSDDVEEHVRAAMIAAIGKAAALTLTAVYREETDVSHRIEVIADVTAVGPGDAKVEKIVTTVGVEPGIFAISWKRVLTNDDERELVGAQVAAD